MSTDVNSYKPYVPRPILTPDQHPAYKAAHDIADTAYDAFQIKALAEQAQQVGFGPSTKIYDIAHSVGSLLEQSPNAATAWPKATHQL